jgi:hypothetical protein
MLMSYDWLLGTKLQTRCENLSRKTDVPIAGASSEAGHLHEVVGVELAVDGAVHGAVVGHDVNEVKLESIS